MAKDQPTSVSASKGANATVSSGGTGFIGGGNPVSDPEGSGALRRFGVVLFFALLVGAGVVGFLVMKQPGKNAANQSNQTSSRFGTVEVPLSEVLSGKSLALSDASSVTINGGLRLNSSLTIAPSVQPTGAKPGQIYYDQGNNQLAYYNGSNFVFLTSPTEGGVQSLGGATGQLSVGSGLSLADGQLANDGVLAVQGESGEVTFTAGPGIVINGTNFSNSGVLSIKAGTPNVTVANDGSGGVTISVTGSGGSGTVASSGGTSGTIPMFTAAQNIENSIISQSGLTVTVGGSLSVTSALTLGSALTVANGGTGATSLTANGVLVGQGTSAVTSVAAGGTGLCLLSTVGAPTWGACGGGSGVSSLNSLTGALSIANASGAGSTITIDNASTSAKGIASFNSSNFSVSSGAVNTIQNIGTGATPTFAGVNTNSITPSAALTLGATGQSFTMQGSAASTITATSGGNTTTISFATPTAARSIVMPNESGTVCLQSSSSCGFALASGATGYIQNGTTTQTANFNIQSAASGSIAALIQGASGQSVDILQVKANAVANSLFSIASAGAATFRNSANSTSAFQIQNATASATLFSADTSNAIVKILPVGTITNITIASGTGALQIGADSSANVALDDNEIMARSNGATSTLFVQKLGGGMTVKANATTFQNVTDSTSSLQVLNSAGTTIALNVDTTNGRVGIGTSGPIAGLQVTKGLFNAGLGQAFNIFSVDSAAAAQNVGGGIGFGGNADTERAFAVIQGFHESATASDFAGALRFFTRPSGGNLTEQVRIGSTGDALFKNSTNSATAFRVQNAAGSTTVLAVDTSAATVTVSALVSTGNLTVNGHIVSGGSTPAIAAGAAACTTPTVSVNGTDTAGLITVTSGTGCSTGGKLATITFNTAFGSAPRVVLTAAGSTTAGLHYYIDNATIATTSFDVTTQAGDTITDSTAYRWYYHVIQ